MNRKIALITGASRGLGKNTALHLAAQGIDIIGTYHSRATEAQAVVSEVEKLDGRAVMLQLDVSNSAGFDAFAAEVLEKITMPDLKDFTEKLLYKKLELKQLPSEGS